MYSRTVAQCVDRERGDKKSENFTDLIHRWSNCFMLYCWGGGHHKAKNYLPGWI